MKKIIYILMFFVVAVGMAASGIIESLSAYTTGNEVSVEWRTSAEKPVTRFEIERSEDGSQTFKYISSVYPKGDYSSYSYVDQDAYRATAGETVQTRTAMTYRLKICYTSDSVSYTNAVSVVPKMNGIRRTWGMIKELFR